MSSDVQSFALWDFPRGGRVLKFGCEVSEVVAVKYTDPYGAIVTMDPKSYLVTSDRLILAQDVWPQTASGLAFTVFVQYRV